MKILKYINDPLDLKKFKISELGILADEIRELIVDVVSKNGGHLSSNLGVVELSIAIHYVFNSPNDKVIWDVGHQSYAHKILTGRKDQIHTLRQHGGISGFTKIKESTHDAFSTGHSGTSISAGLGILCAKSLKNDDGKVISIIGDGSLTSGLAYEALNQTGHLRKKLIVILNDNEMSISKNVGALSSLLSRAFATKYMQELKDEIGDFLKSVPKIGLDIYQLAKRSKECFKMFITPGMLFEAFNLRYYGPIDGHRIDLLIEMLNNVKENDKPVLLHVITTKGKGYSPAENNPVYFHGVGSFEIETGTSLKKRSVPTYTDIFGQTIVELAKKDKKIIAVTAAMPEGTGLSKFSKIYPERFFDVGIAEEHGVTFAAGMALEGFKPVVAIYSTFLQRAYDQILHDVCLESIHVFFAIDRGGLVGDDGPTHHGVFDLSYLRSLPNMVIMAPKDENEFKKMILTGISHNGPIALRYPRGSGIGVQIDENVNPVEIGKGEILREGNDVLIFAIGSSVNEALKAYDILAKENIFATVVNARFVKPLDRELICSLVKKIPNIITVEENVLQGGFGSAVLECLNDELLTDYRLKRIGIPDIFIEHGSQSLLRSIYGLDSQGIVETIKNFSFNLLQCNG
ncbi:MAG: 1-deoxy-D-xylulose-5-phosphate synthase [Desulfobacterales bacterium]|nr:1-deoxy-D-xylulose-5-phosphate synthase [Desulfobacterales bacterium]